MRPVFRLVPAAAVVAGAIALVPGLSAPAGPDLPAASDPSPTARVAVGDPAVVDGETWDVMALQGSRRAPPPKPVPPPKAAPRTAAPVRR